MDIIEKNRLNKLVYITFFITAIYLIINNTSNKILISLLVVIIGACIVYYNTLKSKQSITKYLLLGIICLTYYLIFYIDKTGIALIFIFIIISMVTINYDVLTGLLFVTINFSLTTLLLYIKPTSFDISMILLLFIEFYFVYTFSFLLKYQMEQKKKLKRLSKELENKKSELENAYEKIQENMDLVEEATIIKERNRLAGEIHDTVGHTLTTSLVQLEASKRLIDKDKEKAKKALDNVQSQIRKGLKDLRLSIKDLTQGHDHLDFESSVKAFIKETEKSCSVKIHLYIGRMPDLNINVQKTIFRSLQEGITNGIKHGQSKEFDIVIKYEKDILLCSIKDYGVGMNNIVPGFGLSNMKYRVENLNGILNIYSKKSVGTILTIKVIIRR